MGRAPTPAATGIKHQAFPTNTVKQHGIHSRMVLHWDWTGQ